MRSIIPFVMIGILWAMPVAAVSGFSDGAQEKFAGVGALPDGLGVNIHFTDARSGELEMLAVAGFRWVRMDFSWGAIEREPGKYDFAAYDRLIGDLQKHHLRAIFILDYSNRNYDQDLSPHSEEGRAAFAKWAAASAIHFKSAGVIWEMYNEPNIGFWRPKPNVSDYTKLALAVGKVLHDAAPDQPYIGPACSTMDFKFLEECFKAGCLKYWRAVSVHPYRQMNPESVAADYKHLSQLIAQYAPKERHIPIISGEWGYSSAWKNFDPQKQGKFLPRELLANVASGVPISIWYDWHDDGENPTDAEHHFGTVQFPYQAGQNPVYEPKPAYLAMRTLAKELDGCHFERRIDTGNPEDWVLLLKSDSVERIAAWTAGPSHDVQIPHTTGTFHVTDYLGQQEPHVRATAQGLNLNLTDAPQYLRGSNEPIK